MDIVETFSSPTLRDAEGDLAVCRRSPLKPLIETAFGAADRDELQEVADQICTATSSMMEFESVSELEKAIATSFWAMSGMLKAVLRAKAERAVEGLRNTVGQIVTLFEPQ
jgi:hypothetical protein